MKRGWRSNVYGFFSADVKIQMKKGQKATVFTCMNNPKCGGTKIHRYLDTADRNSTGNLLKHATGCWGNKVHEAVMGAKDPTEARNNIIKPYLRSRRITTFFERKDMNIPVYSALPMSHQEIWYGHTFIISNLTQFDQHGNRSLGL